MKDNYVHDLLLEKKHSSKSKRSLLKCVTMYSITQKWKDKSNTNDDERNEDFKCETCKKSFSSAGNLKKHIHIIHQGHKDYKCESCRVANRFLNQET